MLGEAGMTAQTKAVKVIYHDVVLEERAGFEAGGAGEEGGFVQLEAPLPVGTELTVELLVGEAEPGEGSEEVPLEAAGGMVARVERVREGSTKGPEPGMLLRFLSEASVAQPRDPLAKAEEETASGEQAPAGPETEAAGTAGGEQTELPETAGDEAEAGAPAPGAGAEEPEGGAGEPEGGAGEPKAEAEQQTELPETEPDQGEGAAEPIPLEAGGEEDQAEAGNEPGTEAEAEAAGSEDAEAGTGAEPPREGVGETGDSGGTGGAEAEQTEQTEQAQPPKKKRRRKKKKKK
jgi:hypothetical protein